MAEKNFRSNPSYSFFPLNTENPVISDTQSFEFDESDVWNSTPPPIEKPKKPIPSSRLSKKSAKRDDRGVAAASSAPVNIPDWSKILGKNCRDSGRTEIDEASEEEEDWLPPHELLAKQFARARIASFSLHEGIGRTLKGRDLSRVRNAIWEKTGFQD